MTDNDLVERVARAIGEANATNFTVVSFPKCNWIAEARAAIEEIRRGDTPITSAAGERKL